MEFHISRVLRQKLDTDELLFSYTGNVIFGNVAASRKLAKQLTELRQLEAASGLNAEQPLPVNAGSLFAMGLIDELNHALVARYRKEIDPSVLSDAMDWFRTLTTPEAMEKLLLAFTDQFPTVAVYRGELTPAEWLNSTTEGMPNREAGLEELMLLWLANSNPAFAPFHELFEDSGLEQQTIYRKVTTELPGYFSGRPPVSPTIGSLIDALRAPFLASPDSLVGQLDFIREHWVEHLGQDLRRVLLAIDVIREEDVAIWMRFHPPTPDKYSHGAPNRSDEGFVGDDFIGYEEDFIVGPDGVRHRRYASDYQAPLNEYEAFSADQAWMPNVVLIAKSTYVWLEQLSQKYQRHIYRLDQIPDEELKLLASRGITALWLIGLWERSTASQTIKRLRGHGDAVASAYSLKGYQIAEDLGGESGYQNLRDRAAATGIRLASDMVPNHMGIDSDWVIEHPDWFLYRWESPFPVYSFEGPDLSTDHRVEIKIEDHYYDQSDAAVVFRLRHHREATTRYVYHGNDGTTFAWNDTAQLDYSKAAVREHVIQTILHVARLFPIIRFDAAMVLAKRHVQRLWFPLPGAGGSIPSRAENAMTEEEFETLMPEEFWREVVDRVATEVPGTLLLAEAFWLLEGYFVRTLGMHRVYNSAFMNMLRDEENAKYRSYLKKTIGFDPDILKRYVSFMSNPDERTAVDQFGSGDKYFGVCTLLATLPGLPMFAHGQIEGFTERYGMEFKRARLQEYPHEDSIARHQHEIAPLLKNRQLFAESTNFVLYDFWTDHGTVDENVFAYSNRHGGQRALILYNNSYGSTHGAIHISAASIDKASGHLRQRSIAEGLALPFDDTVILAYRDSATGLEYLRRSTDFHQYGLSLGLRGYQYTVLMNWRELYTSEDQPWHKLCDALNGAGVYSVEEALSKLRLRPVHEALRQAICPRSIQKMVEISIELMEKANDRVREKELGPLQIKEVEITEEVLLTGEAHSERVTTEDIGRNSSIEEEMPAFDPRLASFVEKSEYFAEIAIGSFSEEIESPPLKVLSTSIQVIQSVDTAFLEQEDIETKKIPAEPTRVAKDAPQSYKKTCEGMVISALQVISRQNSVSATQLKKLWSPFYDKKSGGRPDHAWAPLIAWIIVRAMPKQYDKASVFDRLQLRSILAEIFSSLGIEGEGAWEAAARVRILLSHESKSLLTILNSDLFWSDPDVRWLAGVNEAFGQTYFNKNRFEELVDWLQLPVLITAVQQKFGEPDPIRAADTAVVDVLEKAQKAGYNLSKFIAMAISKELLAVAEETSKEM
jgi:hypothetical protein